MGNDVNVVENGKSVGETLNMKGKDKISYSDESKMSTSSIDESELIYEGQEHI